MIFPCTVRLAACALLALAPLAVVEAQISLHKSQDDFKTAVVRAARSSPKLSLMSTNEMPIDLMYVIKEFKKLAAKKTPGFNMSTAKINVSLKDQAVDDIVDTDKRVWFWSVSAAQPPVAGGGFEYTQTERLELAVFMNRTKVAAHFKEGSNGNASKKRE